MIKNKEKHKSKNKGITLIALVITIIVLLILAGVTIATLTGDNGILTRAQEAKNKTEEASDIEKIRLAISEAQIGDSGYQELDATKFQQALNSQFEGTNLQLSELKAFRDDVNSGNTYEGWYVYLTNDITLDVNEEWEPIGIYQEDSTNPDDETNIPFEGIFDGRFNTVSGIYTNSSLKNRGLFGFIKESTIKNIGIINGNIQGTSRTGAIIGYAYENSKIINCYNSANIIATDNFVGGIVGFAKQNIIIKNCYNSGNITATDNIGGIIGGMENTTIKNCYNKGMLDGNSAGGISGITYESAIIENCYNIGFLNATNLALSINNRGNSLVSFKNNYYLENTINGADDKYPIEECELKTSQEMKELYTMLGKSYKEDTNNVNNGYPILQWQ